MDFNTISGVRAAREQRLARRQVAEDMKTILHTTVLYSRLTGLLPVLTLAFIGIQPPVTD